MFAPLPRVRFDVFTLDLSRCVLLRGDEELALRRQSFDVLRCLAERRGKIVSKEELIKAVWAVAPARPEDSLVQCIKDIRRALGEDARWIIRTVSGSGYEFMAEVTADALALPAAPAPPSPSLSPAPLDTSSETRPRPSEPVAAPPRQWQRALIAAGFLITVFAASSWLVWDRARPKPPPVLTMMAVPSLAVLPFKTLGNEPDLGDAARALFDDVRAGIWLAPGRRLIKLQSSAAYRGGGADLETTGRQLGARYLVLGIVGRDAGILHATLQVIEAETGRRLWTVPFQYAPGAQNPALAQIARTIVVENIITVESRRPLPAKPEAAHYTLLAQAVLNNARDAAANREALALLEKALDLDRNWVPALVLYANAQVAEVQNGWVPQDEHAARLGKAEEAVERAIGLVPLHYVAFHVRGQLLRERGDPNGAIAAIERALAINRNFVVSHAELGRAKIDAGRANEAIAHIEEAIRLSPSDPSLPTWYFWAGQAALHAGNDEAALQWFLRARRANPANTDPVPWLAVAYAGLGREDEGRALIREHLARQNLTISGWNKRNPLGAGVLAEQRARIAATLARLGVPEGKVQTGSVQ